MIALLEGRCAYEAARNATDADLQALEALHDKLNRHARARRINDYYAVNFAIHEAIITLADNRWLAQVIGDLRKIVKLARLQQLHAPGRLEQSLTEHMAVFAALKARDAEGAEAAMRTHLTRQREALRELARAQRRRSHERHSARISAALCPQPIARCRSSMARSVSLLRPALEPKAAARARPPLAAGRTRRTAAERRRRRARPASAWAPRCGAARRPCRRACCAAR